MLLGVLLKISAAVPSFADSVKLIDQHLWQTHWLRDQAGLCSHIKVMSKQMILKFDSLFNELSHYHVCQPGLPPCIGHDLFEGIVSYDLALCIKHLVKVEKQFTCVELNRRVNQFRYLGNDAHDKPSEINPGSDKLGGHAVQNWCFLRLLPVLIGDKIRDPVDNDVWQLAPTVSGVHLCTCYFCWTDCLLEGNG